MPSFLDVARYQKLNRISVLSAIPSSLSLAIKFTNVIVHHLDHRGEGRVCLGL